MGSHSAMPRPARHRHPRLDTREPSPGQRVAGPQAKLAGPRRRRLYLALALCVATLLATGGFATAGTRSRHGLWQQWAQQMSRFVKPDARAAASRLAATRPAAAAATSAAEATSASPVVTPSRAAGAVVPGAKAAAAPPAAAANAGDRMFSSSSFWYSRIPAAVTLDPASAAKAADIAQQAATHYGGAAFNAHQYNAPIYRAPASTPTVDIRFDDCQHKGYTPDGLTDQFSNVPLPADAAPAAGTDGELALYSPSLDQAWEFWQLRKTGGQWSACWGGRIDHASRSQGIFTGGFGATATGLPANLAGAVTFADVNRGSIDHVMALQLVSPAGGAFSWPAQRTDGFSTAATAVAEGQRLRLDPSVDVESLGLNPVAAMVAKAAQSYGFVVTDKAGAVSVLGETSTPQRAGAGQSWDAILKGVPDYAVFRGFPWSRIQVLPMNYGQ